MHKINVEKNNCNDISVSLVAFSIGICCIRVGDIFYFTDQLKENMLLTFTSYIGNFISSIKWSHHVSGYHHLKKDEHENLNF